METIKENPKLKPEVILERKMNKLNNPKIGTFDVETIVQDGVPPEKAYLSGDSCYDGSSGALSLSFSGAGEMLLVRARLQLI